VTAAVKAARPQWAFHTAVHGAYPFQTAIRDMIRTNIVGTVNLVQACLAVGVEALVNTGSSSEYGFKDHAPSEEEALSPNSDYAVTKASATLYCRQVARTADMHVPTLRLYSVYGPFEEPSRLIPTLIVHGLAGTLPPLVNPAVARDFVFVDDAIEAYLLAASLRSEERGPVYNVGTGVQSTLAEVVDTARDLLHIGVVPAWGSLRAREWDTNV
jgi:dolichol-phosphate mannosyltransferase